ncbi:MAG: N-acetylmuramoyl-L-alanine amidase [Candidatus Fimimorpha sp.]
MAKIAIDAGHGGRDPGAVYQGRQEKDDTLRLALAVGEILKQNGVDVTYTRTGDVYDSPLRKAQIANEANVDYLVSIHRNAMPVPQSASGIETLVYQQGNRASGLARDINEQLQAVGFQNRGVIPRPNLAVLRRSRMPAVLVEVGFIDNDKDNQLFDEEFDSIAQAIADGILKYLNSQNSGQNSNPNQDSSQEQMLYRVQVGAFKNPQFAYQLMRQLQQEGYPVFTLYDNGYYRVQVGAFQYMDNAVRMEQRLRRAGYQTYLTT